MPNSVTVTFRHLDRSAALEFFANELAHRLDHLNGHIARSQWTLEGERGHRDQVVRYRAKLLLQVPGAQIHAENHAPEPDVHQALRQAYDNAKRQLQDLRHARRVPLA